MQAELERQQLDRQQQAPPPLPKQQEVEPQPQAAQAEEEHSLAERMGRLGVDPAPPAAATPPSASTPGASVAPDAVGTVPAAPGAADGANTASAHSAFATAPAGSSGAAADPAPGHGAPPPVVLGPGKEPAAPIFCFEPLRTPPGAPRKAGRAKRVGGTKTDATAASVCSSTVAANNAAVGGPFAAAVPPQATDAVEAAAARPSADPANAPASAAPAAFVFGATPLDARDALKGLAGAANAFAAPPAAAPTAAAAVPAVPARTAEELAAEDSSWRAAEAAKEQGNRRFAIKEYERALDCYSKARPLSAKPHLTPTTRLLLTASAPGPWNPPRPSHCCAATQQRRPRPPPPRAPRRSFSAPSTPRPPRIVHRIYISNPD